MRSLRLSPELVLSAYQQGAFPMAHPEHGNAIYWYAPDPRAVLPLEGLHVPRNVARVMRRRTFDVTVDQAFEEVIRSCAARAETWISQEIISVFTALHRTGYAHSVEVLSNGSLAGGLYGVALGGAFFGESMFHTETDASKVALVYLATRLLEQGFVLLDTQFSTPHLARFGVVEIPRAEYERRLAHALIVPASWKGTGA